ncbi:MAG: Holliday junction branch migration protein RuvA [Anaerolineales bacterium]|nr:Holliday junction branch migration protein RuvA [Anaerolineales bacterium]MCS7247025.1 Holliday junction branch migration protein RuvA [Anaerolineales bacterium]MDW8160836.1 Holliday junction branch migration protein RuvA [Anaerolineales bacterium]MDW8446808.1 Holliday junction branch migration protein RuvA [Anaerolineales bacterium]
MIASLSGVIREVNEDSVVVENQGVGYLVYVPKPLCNRLTVGDQAFFYTQLLVREDSLTLVGFETAEARRLFNLLIGVNGIGFRLALSILSSLDVGTLRRAIVHSQAEVLERVPGLGRKTAQKILLSLQDKIQDEMEWGQLVPFSDVDEEVLSALTSLGYSVVEAQAAIQAIPKDTPKELEIRLRVALGYFSRNL